MSYSRRELSRVSVVLRRARSRAHVRCTCCVPFSYGLDTIAALNAHMEAVQSGEGIDSEGDMWRTKLNTLFQAFRGASAVLPSLPGRNGDEDVVAVGRHDLWPAGHEPPATPLRDTVVDFVSEAAAYLAKYRGDDTKAIDLVTMLANRLLSGRGVRRSKRDRAWGALRCVACAALLAATAGVNVSRVVVLA